MLLFSIHLSDFYVSMSVEIFKGTVSFLLSWFLSSFINLIGTPQELLFDVSERFSRQSSVYQKFKEPKQNFILSSLIGRKGY